LTIRDAVGADGAAIAALLASLGYPGTGGFIGEKIAAASAHPDARLLVCEDAGVLLGCLSLHFIPQIALTGDFCRISYFCVAADARGRGIGAQLEAAGEALARARSCDRIEVHCHARRVDAHRFYARQGYAESPKYFFKSLL
jgi:GNAT superfamily N-acetyltransferase